MNTDETDEPRAFEYSKTIENKYEKVYHLISQQIETFLGINAKSIKKLSQNNESLMNVNATLNELDHKVIKEIGAELRQISLEFSSRKLPKVEKSSNTTTTTTNQNSTDTTKIGSRIMSIKCNPFVGFKFVFIKLFTLMDEICHKLNPIQLIRIRIPNRTKFFSPFLAKI